MGNSTSIDALKAQNSAFDAYLQQATANLNNRVGPVQKAFLKAVDDYYTASKITDQVVYGSQDLIHFSQIAEYDLSFIQPVATTLAKGLLAGTSLPGASAAATATATVAGAALAVDPLVDTAVICIAAVMGIMDSSSSSTYSQSIRSQRLGPGLTLHAYGMADQTRSKQFLNNDVMVESAVGYRLVWSGNLNKIELSESLYDLYGKMLAKDSTSMLALSNHYDDLTLDFSNATSNDEAADITVQMTRVKTSYNDMAVKLQALEKSLGVSFGAASLALI